MLEIQISNRTETGARSRNEDYLTHGLSDGGWFAVLSDGAGGHADGAVASDLAVHAAMSELCHRSATDALSAEAMRDVVARADTALKARQEGLKGRARMHATLVALWIDREARRALWTHVGDSRLYALRRGRIEHVTRDDSIVQSMVEAGLMAPEVARTHPNRNRLESALGTEEPALMRPGTEYPLRDGDAFLLCSDGWHDRMSDADIEQCFLRAQSVDEWLDKMRVLVTARREPNQDNFSAIGVWVGRPAEVTRLVDPPQIAIP